MKEITIKYDESKKADLMLDFVVEFLLPHIIYSNNQYGDSDVDVVSTWTAKECLTNVERYIRRFGKNERPGQEKLDIIKCIDYLIRMYYKSDVETTKTKEEILLERLYDEITENSYVGTFIDEKLYVDIHKHFGHNIE